GGGGGRAERARSAGRRAGLASSPTMTARTPLLLALFAAPAAALSLTPSPSPPPASAIRLRDVAREAGLDFVLENSPTPRKHLIETMPGGVAAFDYDGDGRIDLFFTNGA